MARPTDAQLVALLRMVQTTTTIMASYLSGRFEKDAEVMRDETKKMADALEAASARDAPRSAAPFAMKAQLGVRILQDEIRGASEETPEELRRVVELVLRAAGVDGEDA